MSCFGKDSKLEPQKLLGIVARTLHAAPVLSPLLIEQTLAVDPYTTLLKQSNLAEEIEHVRITPAALSLEELSKLWTAFQGSYRMGAAYLVSVVLIEAQRPTRAAVPHRSFRGRAVDGHA